MKERLKKLSRYIWSVKLLVCILCVAMVTGGLSVFATSGKESSTTADHAVNYVVMDRYDKYITNSFSDSLEGIMSIKKVYWLSDTDIVAPEPDPACYGEVEDPKQMLPILNQAAELIEGQEMVFSTNVKLCPGTKIRYYYDPTILVITWQEVRNNSVYSISEVKIADASQFRRFLSNGEYGSGARYLTSEMAASVNAVVATNGDYYGIRQVGCVVYNGQLMRMEGRTMDSCYIDDQGDLHLVRAGEIVSEEKMEQFIEENNIRFSLSFGPILVENGKAVKIKNPYCVGEVDTPNPRAALCQKDTRHYLLVLCNEQYPYTSTHKLWTFAENLEKLGVKTAYNLDGGRSGSLIMNDEKINYIYERKITDIIYFATAYSNGD